MPGAASLSGEDTVAGILPAGLFNGAPTAMSQRCPGWPCAGLGALDPPACAVDAVVPELLESAAMADGADVEMESEEIASAVSFSVEFWQEANRSAIAAMLRILFTKKGGLNS